jgi:hypothetical protein
MKDIIKLQSKYASDNNYLKKIAGTEKSYELKTEYCYRAGFISENKAFIDPSGGPMIIEGEYLHEADAIVDTIKNGVITFK